MARRSPNITDNPVIKEVSDNGKELTSSAILHWSQERRIEWLYTACGKPLQNGFVERLALPQLGSMVACAADVPTKPCQPR
jgi:transposase InsO family protein